MNGDVLYLQPLEAHALWAADYDRNANPLLVLEERFVLPLISELKGGVTLDLACGTGRWLDRLIHCGIQQAVGMDLSREMLGEARRKKSLEGRLVETDCMVMPLSNSFADFAICSFGVGYLRNLPAFAREVSRITKNQGHLIVTDFHPAAEDHGWKRSFRRESSVVEITHFTRPLDQVISVFEAEGFDLVHREEPEFGEPERMGFEQCGRPDLFEKVLGVPALFICVFRRGGL